MTFDDAEKKAETLGIELAHECDERAKECSCERDEEAPEGHAPGDTRCPSRGSHSACSHDVGSIARAQQELLEQFLNERVNRLEREMSRADISDQRHSELEARRDEWESVKQIYDAEGFGGREDQVTSQASAEEICTERRDWLREMRAEGLR